MENEINKETEDIMERVEIVRFIKMIAWHGREDVIWPFVNKAHA